jgi:hypothetical protein
MVVPGKFTKPVEQTVGDDKEIRFVLGILFDIKRFNWYDTPPSSSLAYLYGYRAFSRDD